MGACHSEFTPRQPLRAERGRDTASQCSSSSSTSSAASSISASSFEVDGCREMYSEMDTGKCPAAAEKRTSQGASWAGIGHVCRKGQHPKPCELPNQDSWSVQQLSSSRRVYGVFDGHGPRGHVVSDYVKKHLMTRVVKIAEVSDGQQQADDIIKAFLNLHDSILTKPLLRAQGSGTTATIAIHDYLSDTLSLHHVGDSTAAILRTAPGSRLECAFLTRDHKPEVPEESARIIAHGGDVRSQGGLYRVYKKRTAVPGLNLSRSLGDGEAHAVGVSAEPEASTYSLGLRDRWLLLCSDGIWEVLSRKAVAAIISEFEPEQCQAAAERLYAEARKLWIAGTHGEKCDDITVILVDLMYHHFQGTPKSTCAPAPPTRWTSAVTSPLKRTETATTSTSIGSLCTCPPQTSELSAAWMVEDLAPPAWNRMNS